MAQDQRNQQTTPNPRQNPTPMTPNQGDRTPTSPSPAEPGSRSDNLANSGQENEEPRRYDEADPNWQNPDVQMQNKQNNVGSDEGRRSEAPQQPASPAPAPNKDTLM